MCVHEMCLLWNEDESSASLWVQNLHFYSKKEKKEEDEGGKYCIYLWITELRKLIMKRL